MTEGLAIEIAKQKMLEWGVGENHLLRFKHVKIDAQKQKQFTCFNELLILIEPNEDLYAYSNRGVYDENDEGLNELQYIHSGIVKLKNQKRNKAIHIKLLQVIPNQKQD